MPPRPPARAPAAPGRPAPALTPISHSTAWQTASAQHSAALLPTDTSAEAFDRAATAFWKAGAVEHTFTHANLALLRMAQAEEHHLAQMQAAAALRQDIAGLNERLTALHATLVAVGKVAASTRRELGQASAQATELLAGLAEALDERREGGPLRAVEDEEEALLDELDGPPTDLEGSRTAPQRREAGRAPQLVNSRAPALEPGSDEEELVEVDEHGIPMQEEPS